VSVRIAVSDPLPIYRRGVIMTLGDAGYRPEEPESLLKWMVEEQKRVAFITLQSREDFMLLKNLKDTSPHAILIALLIDGTTDSYVKAVESGASVAMDRNATPREIMQVFDAAVAGMSMLPIEVVRALVASPAVPKEPDYLAAQEVEWLRALSQGITVTELAENVGYSERAMYRLLRTLYRRMGVANRTEAVLKASREGWI
jgi:DNA-binding NarL/FixJ family response regulator